MDLEALEAGITTNNAEETEGIGKALANLLPDVVTISLHGDLGTGKTTFIRGLCAGLGVSEGVKSPTFNLYSIYKGMRQIIHLDAYRLDSAEAMPDLYLEELLKPPYALLIEWPEKIKNWLPEDSWHLYGEVLGETQRRYRLKRP